MSSCSRSETSAITASLVTVGGTGSHWLAGQASYRSWAPVDASRWLSAHSRPSTLSSLIFLRAFSSKWEASQSYLDALSKWIVGDHWSPSVFMCSMRLELFVYWACCYWEKFSVIYCSIYFLICSVYYSSRRFALSKACWWTISLCSMSILCCARIFSLSISSFLLISSLKLFFFSSSRFNKAACLSCDWIKACLWTVPKSSSSSAR